MKFESADTRSTFCASTFVKPTAASRMTTTDAMAVITYNVLFDDFVFMMRSFPLLKELSLFIDHIIDPKFM